MTTSQDYLALAIRAARAAARIQAYHVGGELDIETKSSETDLVTHVDKLCEKEIREIIERSYPEHAILGEEQGQEGKSSHRWIVDPIDGTLNYAHDIPFYCVSIALEIEGQLEVGVVYDGVRDELFTAVRGEGAKLNGAPIGCSSTRELIKSMLATGFAYQKETIHENVELFGRVHQKVRSIRRFGSAALDLCYVACGRLEGFWELKLQPWDVAAGVLIVQEAGGTVTGAAGEPYRLGNPVLVATNGRIHMKLVHLLGLAEAIA